LKRRFTKRALSLALVAGVLALAGATAQAGWLYVLSAGVLGLIGASLFYGHRLGAVEVRRSMPARAVAGDEVRARLSVTNDSTRSVPPFRVDDHFPATGRASAACERLAREGRAELEFPRVAERRGVFTAAPVTLSSGAPFGLMRAKRTLEVSSPMTVVPGWVELRSFPILEPSSYPSDVLHERARTGAGEEFLGVREYRPGDSPRAVHWRSTARAGRLMVREYEEHPSARVAVVLTGADHGSAPESSFEMLVSAVASVALYAIATGHPVELVRPTPDGDADMLVEPEKDTLLDWLAAAEPVDAGPSRLVSHALAGLGRRGTLVMCAATAGDAGAGLREAAGRAQAAGARVLVVAALSSSWTDETVGEIDPSSLGGGRAGVRVLRRGESLRSCLEG
jgi:uncharacterized protein (DUF58 family)